MFLPVERTSKLRDWQVDPAVRLIEILQDYPSAVDMSDTGTGKTYVATAVAIALGLPTLVIAPKISLTNWQRVAAEFNDSFSVTNYESIRTGNTDFGHWQYQDRVNQKRETSYICQCCQQRVDIEDTGACNAHPDGIHCLETKKAKIKYGRFEFHPGVKMIVWDEAQRLGGINSLNSDVCIAATRQGIKQLFLSATLAVSPLKMKAVGFALGLFTL
jgi:uncharacterized protein YlaI